MGKSKKILLVEDEQHLAKGLAFNLHREGYEVTVAEDGEQALNQLEQAQYDMMILDLMLPKVGGMEVIRRIREKDIRFPILMLTAKSTDQDRTAGLEAGADDYLAKPFHLPELLLRIQGILRRKDWYEKPDNLDSEYHFDGMWIDFNTGKAKGLEGEFYLTAKELMVMSLLISNKGKVVAREELLEKVWGYAPDTETRTIDNFIVRLRKYFEKKPQKPRLIQTVREKGYQFDAPE